jgi:hypothetical protein
MRNDARPIGGERSHQSPVVNHQSEVVGHPSTVGDLPSGIYRPRPESLAEHERPAMDFEVDELVMPSNDSTLNTKI